MIIKTQGQKDTKTQAPLNAVRRAFLSAGAAILVWTAACCAQTVSSAELIEKAAEYDGKTVEYQGEVIGDVMARGDHAWVNLLEGSSAVGVWMAAEDARKIVHGGAYLVRGDTIGVAGTFHRSCPEHGGDLDIHADGVTRAVPGARFFAEPSAAKVKMAVGLGMILGVIWTLSILKKR